MTDKVSKVTVTATGSANAPPEFATFSVSVSSKAADPAKAMEKNSVSMEHVIKMLKAMDPRLTNDRLQTAYVSVAQEHRHQDDKTPVEFVASNTLTVKCDIDAVGDLMVRALGCGGTNLYGPQFGLSPQTLLSLQSDARTAANGAARGMAEQHAEESGAWSGDEDDLWVESVVEGSSHRGAGRVYGMTLESAGGGSVPIEAGELSVSVTVTTVFGYHRT